MQIQRLSLPNHTLTTPTLSHSMFCPSLPSTNYSTNSVCIQNSKSRLSYSLKMVPESLTSSRKCGGLIRVRCGEVQNDDGFYIRRCVELARKAIGHTSPNPMVGCVIVKDGNIVGEGFHPKAGQPHAEVFALRDAGDLAENATAYVSFEPCNHYGRTPPCSEALIKAKVKKAVVGIVDPNPIVDSKGIDRLRDAGIEVIVGVEEDLCKKLNEGFIHKMLTGKPFVTLRYSLSINGHVLDQLGEGVTESGGYYSRLLQEYDGIILSASFAEKFSVPTSQEPGANQPLKIITASNPSTPIQMSGLTEENASKVIVFSDKETTVEPETAKKGIETVVLDQISLNAILEYCKHQGLCSVLLDLRGNYGDLEMLLKEGIEKNLVQKIVVEVLPLWDESDGRNTLCVLKSLGKGLKLKNLQPNMSSQSIVLEGYL
ncbi:hypothetical protein QYF36_021182 [Acer negundo]|nr:hypothetical protein QYF36_021182 [Acer negundo]